MFNKNFYPTPEAVVLEMIKGLDLTGKVVLEPSAGKGNIIDILKRKGAKVLCCENNEDLAQIAKSKATFLKPDFFDVTAAEISHVDYIIMNPPFDHADDHILHAFNIAPKHAMIISLCNASTIENPFSKKRKELVNIIQHYGEYTIDYNSFSESERKTEVATATIKIFAREEKQDWSHYFDMSEDEIEEQHNGIMPYNVVRDAVQRYVAAVRLYDNVSDIAVQMNSLVGTFGVSQITLTLTEDKKEHKREEFKIELQKKAWQWVFDKLQMEKYVTESLMSEINKYCEDQKNIPFTMKNVYKMLEVIAGTHGERMKRVLVEVFDSLTKHYDENRFMVEGWKTNSHYMINQKFILPYVVNISITSTYPSDSYNGNSKKLEELIKALCYLTGKQYDRTEHSLRNLLYVSTDYKWITNDQGQQERIKYYTKEPKEFNKWYDWNFFEIKFFKKGTAHIKFKDKKVWLLFNESVSKIKGYVIPESVKK